MATTSIKLKPRIRTQSSTDKSLLQNQRNYFDLFAKQQGFKNLDDWYNVDKSLLENIGGSFLSKKTLYQHLKTTYPEHDWIPWKFDRVPRGFWKNNSNQKWFFDWLGKELGVTQLDDWYKHLSGKEIMERGGVGLLHMNNNSLFNTLKTVYPYHNWIRWNFTQSRAPSKYWQKSENHREYFDWLGKELGVKQLDDWYSLLTRKNMNKYRGAGIVRDHSLYTALMDAYPEHNWLPWKFDKTYASYWKELSNQRKFLEWFALQVGIQAMDEWYKVTAAQITKKGGSGLLALHRFSMYSVLSSAYPDYPWKPWNFEKISRYWANDSVAVGAFIAELAEKLHITQLDDWYRVSALQLTQLRALPRLRALGGLPVVLKRLYPDYKWEFLRFNMRAKRSSQRWLMVAVKQLFPDQEVLEDYWPAHLKFADTERSIQLDVFVPELNLAFEYQGQQHYTDISFFGTQRNYNDRDVIKRDICASHGITLIEVPYWWNGQVASLAATIVAVRKDITFSNIVAKC